MQHRSLGWLLPLAFIVGLMGCQSYTPKPLDLESHRAQWLSRDVNTPEVAAFAARLAGSDDGGRAFDTNDGISRPEAEVIALFYNPDLRMVRLRAGVTAASAANAGLWSDPELSVDGVRILESVAEPWKLFATVGITLPISGRLDAEKARASAEHFADLVRVAEQEWSIRISMRQAWAEWSAATAKADATREFLAQLDHVVGISQQLRDAGELSQAELRTFLAEQATRRADLRAVQSRTIETELAIRALMGLAPSAPLALTPGFADSDRRAESTDITANSPTLAVAVAEYETAERSLALEIRKQYPDLMIGPGYGNEDGMSQALLGLALPLPVVNANRQGIAEAEAKRELARGSYETTYERLAGQLAIGRARMSAATEQRALLDREVVPLVDAQFDDARKIAELGEVNTLLLLDSLTRQYETKLRVVEARLGEAIAVARVEELLGPDIPPTDTKPVAFKQPTAAARTTP